MKPAHPRDILRRAAHSRQLFSGREVVMRLASGGTYRGKWLNGEDSTCLVTLREDTSGSVVWIDAGQVESISFPAATDEMLSVLSDRTYDPFANSEKIGELALTRQLAKFSETLSRSLDHPVRVSTQDLGDATENLSKAVAVDLCRILENAFRQLCKDEFSRSETKKRVNEIMLKPADTCSVRLDGGVLNIDFAWTAPANRWTDGTLVEALNKAL